MIVDSSAIVAILRQEPGSQDLLNAIVSEARCAMSAASFLETAIVVDAEDDPVASRELDNFLQKTAIAIKPFDETQARIAREAYRDFGKGSGHKAQLNFGDCFAYALAKAMNEPLLYKGTDFSHTDVRPAL
ncbi:MAG TPA: type II toxin-antitoxin system VapC family toxin [Rhizomicrobium sp.]|nr:type II toxin-antitoxin system VapC family toxin [Rhizomicrobium sp.]